MRISYHLALKACFVLLCTGTIVALGVALLRLNRARPAGGRDAPASAPSPLNIIQVLEVSAWCGLAWGLSESHYLVWKAWILHGIVKKFRYVSSDSLWMAPTVDVCIMLGIGTMAWAVGRVVRRPLSLRWLVFLASGLALACLILLTGRLTTIAGVILAVGIAANIAPLAGRYRAEFLRLVRHTLPRMAAVLAAILLLVTAYPRVLERVDESRLGPAPAAGSPNIIVIVLDTERATNMGLYGYHRPTTPFLDRLARRGVVFDWAMSPANWTLPSHGSMFTSRYPGELSATFLTALDDTWPTLAEVMRERGYMTAGFVANIIFCIPLYGLNRGFIHYEAQPASMQMTVESAWLTRTLYRLNKYDEDRSGVRKDAEQITSSFLAWQGSRRDQRPYLAFLNYFDAHRPYVAPREYRGRFTPDSTGPPKFRGSRASAYTPAQVQRFQDAYDAGIAYVDDALETLFAELDRRGETQKSLIILTADHGEEFGEHDSLGHGMGMNLPVLHVPLVLMHPSLPAGTRVAQPVTLTDMSASVMEFSGVRRHPFRGRSWSRFWKAIPSNMGTEPVFSEYGRRKSVLLGRWHYIVDGGEFLYDVEQDPSELRNLTATADSALMAELRTTLGRFQAADN